MDITSFFCTPSKYKCFSHINTLSFFLDILNMNFYKKEKFTGSYQGMRYLIQKDQEEDAEDENVKHDIFRVTIWPGPYNFASTADDLKSSTVFPFTPEGKEQVVGWLNEQWSARRTEWPGR